MNLRRTIGRALHAMTSTSAPRPWEDDRGTITTAQAATALGLTADPSVAAMAARADNREVRLERDAAQAELQSALRALDAETRQRTYAEGALERQTAQVAGLTRELADAHQQLRLAEARVDDLTEAGHAVNRKNMALTRDVALRTTQRDKARSDRDRALVELEALRAEVDPPC